MTADAFFLVSMLALACLMGTLSAEVAAARRVAQVVMLAVAMVGLLFYRDARADRWTAADSASQAVVLTALAADYLQTRQIVACAQSGERCSDPSANHTEANPVMGERGQRVPVPVYFVGVALAHTAVARALPQPWRRISQVALLAVQVKSIGHNMSYGYSITF